MDASGFDRLTKSLSGVANRRGAVGRLAALLASAAGLTIAAEDEAAAGRRHRRRVRNRHDHDNRKGKRKDTNRPRGAGAGEIRCGRLTDGTPCRNIGELWQMRCCKGVCPEERSCVPQSEFLSGKFCATEGDCRDYAGACCSGQIACDTTFENLCFCLPSGPGEPCVADQNCAAKQCVCGRCQDRE